MTNFKMVAPCLLGIEGVVSGELKRMDCKNVVAENGRVVFEGDYNTLARANICSRYSERILVLLASFTATTFEELFEGVKNIDWEEWIGKTDAFPVKGRTLNSKLASVPTCQGMIKKAVVERMKMVHKLPWFEETGEKHQIQFLIMNDKVSIMLDTSGAGLHKRGYRANSTEAPIKETLAASMADLAYVKGDTILYDPCCGSGTILIESALKALNIAPGLRRRFASERWGVVPQKVWEEERKRANSLITMDRDFVAYGSDIDPNAVELTIENARLAGIPNRIKAEVKRLESFTPFTEKGTIICNPPYGERLLDISQAEEIYKQMGDRFVQKDGFNYYIISPDDDFEECFGRKADKRRKLYNGMLKCQFYMYYR